MRLSIVLLIAAIIRLARTFEIAIDTDEQTAAQSSYRLLFVRMLVLRVSYREVTGISSPLSADIG